MGSTSSRARSIRTSFATMWWWASHSVTRPGGVASSCWTTSARSVTTRSPTGADAGSSDSTSFATRLTESANRDTISSRSSSGVVKGGANSVWSPANPSRVGWVDSTISPASNAARSIRPATPSSGGRNDSPSRGSTYSTPSRKPWPRTSRTIGMPFRAPVSWSRSDGPRSRTRSISRSDFSASSTASPTAHDSGAPSQVCPSVNRREPLATASYTRPWHSTAPMAA